MLRKTTIASLILLVALVSITRAEQPWAKCTGFVGFVECLKKGCVAYDNHQSVVVLNERGVVESTMKLQKGSYPAYVDSDGTLHFYKTKTSGEVSPRGEVTESADYEIKMQGSIPVGYGPGAYVTVYAPGLSLGMHAADRFSGVAVDPAGETIAVVACPFNRTYVRIAKFVSEQWAWLESVPTPDIAMEGSGVLLLPGHNDVRFIGPNRIAFLAQIDEPKVAPKDVIDLTATPIEGKATDKGMRPLYLLYCDLKTGFSRIKARLRFARNGGADYGNGLGSFTVSPDQKWLFLTTGDQIWRLSCEEG